MEGDWGYVLSCTFRFAILTASCHFVQIAMANAFLERRRSLRGISCYMAIKALGINTILGVMIKECCNEFYQQTDWLLVLYPLCVIAASILSYVFIWYTFKGGAARLAAVSFISEGIAVLYTYTTIILVNLLAGRESTGMIGRFQMADLLPPVFGVLLVHVCYQNLQPLFERFKRRHFGHGKLLCSLLAAYIGVVTLNLINEGYRKMIIANRYAVGFCTLGLVIAFYMISKYRKTIRSEQSFLMMQKELMESHYQKVQEQISQIENSREAVSKKMCSIVRHCNGVYGSGNDSVFANGREQASVYMQSLVAEYKGLKAGMYCDDWMLDAVLSSQAERMENQGIEFECSAREYQGGGRQSRTTGVDFIHPVSDPLGNPCQ